MKKIGFIVAVALIIFLLTGCEDYGSITNDTTGKDETPNEVVSSNDSIGTPSIEELSEKANGSDPWGHYKTILAFLKGDAEELAQLGAYSSDDQLKIEDYDFLTTVKIGSYEVSELASGDIDFKFTVSESKSNILPMGEHHYQLGIVWNKVNEYSTDSNYAEILDLIEVLAGHGCTAWENGSPAYDDNGLGFDFSVVRTVQYFANQNNVPDYNGLTEEYVEDSAEKLFGIKGFVPSSEYLKLVDGKWEQTQYIGIVNSVHTVTDIREDGNIIEIDIQYYADKLSMVPSHKVTVYATKNNDDIYEYCIERSVVTEEGTYKPFRWSV